jgi:hypothetical protein
VTAIALPAAARSKNKINDEFWVNIAGFHRDLKRCADAAIVDAARSGLVEKSPQAQRCSASAGRRLNPGVSFDREVQEAWGSDDNGYPFFPD